MILNRDERQDLCIRKWKEAKGKGSLILPTGFGKTRTAMKTIVRLIAKKPLLKVIVIVPTQTLKEQWTLELIERELIQSVDVYIVNTAITRDLTCDLLIVDEVHMMMADTFKAIFTRIAYKLIMCLTGTIDRLDGKQILLQRYAPICDSVDLHEAITAGWVAEYKQYKVLIDVDLTAYQEAHKKFLSHFSFFGFDFNTAMACGTNWEFRAQWCAQHGIENKMALVHGLGFLRTMKARKSFLYDHIKKIEIVNKIINARSDKKIITFTKSVEHAKQICCGELYHGKVTVKKRQKILSDFNAAISGVVNSCKALDVGADVKGVNVAIIISGDSSSITKRQRIGRSIRKEGDKIAEVWHLVIRGTVEEEWYRKSSTGLHSITLDESQLDEYLLKGTFTEKTHKENKHMFRY